MMWPSENKDQSIYRVAEDAKSGKRSPRSLDVKTRQGCVEALAIQGLSRIKIAQVLERSEKTIRRDADQIHSKSN